MQQTFERCISDVTRLQRWSSALTQAASEGPIKCGAEAAPQRCGLQPPPTVNTAGGPGALGTTKAGTCGANPPPLCGPGRRDAGVDRPPQRPTHNTVLPTRDAGPEVEQPFVAAGRGFRGLGPHNGGLV